MKAILVLALVAGGAFGSIATTGSARQPAQQVDQGYAYVVKVQAGEDNYLHINVKGSLSSAHGCGNMAFLRSKRPLSDPRTEALVLLATASFLSGHAVHVWTAGCAGGGNQGYPILTNLQVNRP